MASPAVLLLALAQDPAPTQTAPDQLVWPPLLAAPQQYAIRLQKTRQPDRELAAAEKAARKELGLFQPAQPLRQSVTLAIDLELRGGDQEVQVRYTTRLIEAKGLRLQLRDAVPGASPIGNEHVDAIWGLADTSWEPDFTAPRSALERTFEQPFRRIRGGVATVDFRPHFGDHLLPVLWDGPLPCWIGPMIAVVGLDQEAAIEGKTLIRDGSGNFPLGHRDTRVEVVFVKVAGRSCTLRYQLTVRQQMHKTRDLQQPRRPVVQWVFEVAGEAEYSAADQGFERIREQVRARPADLDGAATARLRDEAFEGSIEVVRVRKPAKEKPRR